MKTNLPKIYAITDKRISNLSHAAQVEKLIAGGAKLIQLRDKEASSEEFYRDAQNALALSRKHDVKILINDRVDVALAIKADGVHLGQDDLPPQNAREMLGDDAIIGFSTHTIAQAKEAVLLPINYVAFGPVFATTTKLDPDDVVGLSGVKQVAEALGNFPLVAIGGINLSNFLDVLEAGADSIAVISDLLSKPENIASKFREFNNFDASW